MGTETPRLTHQSLKVLHLFSERPKDELAGSEMMRATGLSSGTLYPILLRFETHGILESRWEDGDPATLGRPRRRFYSITLDGRAVARQALREIGMPLGAFAPEGGVR